MFNPLNAELNPICHLLALLGAHHILHVSRIRVNATYCLLFRKLYEYLNTLYGQNVEFFLCLNAELNPVCHLLALLGAHHFLHVSRIRIKSLTLRLLMLYIYMEHLFLMFLDHTQRRTTVGRTPPDE